MRYVKIIADSTCDLSEELLKRYEISIIPLNIVLDSKSYLDGVEIRPKQIYEWSDQTGTTPKTSSPEIGNVMNTLKPYQEAGDDVILIGISEEMSVTCQVFRTAAEEMEYSNAYVINSKNLSTGIGLLVLCAAQMAKEGKSANDIVKEIKVLQTKVRASFVVDTLTYLSERHPQHQFRLIMGEDNLVNFEKWKNYKIILENYGIYVYPRPKTARSPLKDHKNIRFVDAPLLEISATFIRNCIREGKSIKYLVHPSVEDYIYAKKLYC